MARKLGETQKTFNIAVVGLSGSEKEKGSMGSGKSCLCNRFVRPFADDFYPDHISVLSQSDFNGRIVNNDHWLYWGEVSKVTDESTELQFSVIEQTEFIDDACFQPFKPGKTEPYYKRCATTRVCSAEKLMYICKNQLGIEKEYEQKYLHDGRFNVDGFVCIFDVSEVQGRSLDKSVEYTALILNSLLKTKKPIVFATTKQDEGSDIYLREAERLVNRKEFRGYIPLIETSAQENINVDLPFVVCAQMIDRNKGKAKIWSFTDALRFRKEMLDYATETFQSLIRMHITDYRSAWHTSLKKLSPTPEFINYCDLFGQEAAHLAFKRHTKRLKEDFIARKMQMYMRILPEVLSELVPDIDSIGENCDWELVKNMLKEHADFDQYFVENPPHVVWHEIDLNDSNDTRIPLDLLDTPEAENCFYEHKQALDSEDKRKDLRSQFKQLLRETGYVTPGKQFNEVRVLFMGRECYESLSEQDLIDLYEEHQKDITDSAKANFQELLQEHSDLFFHFANMGPGSVITQDDIFKITEVMADDTRYKALDRLEQDRTLMLLRHLGFIHGPIREHCPAFPDCVDILIEKSVASKIKRRSGINGSGWCTNASSSLNIVILGAGGLGEELAVALKKVNETFVIDDTRYALDFRIIEGDVDLPQNSFNTADFSPQACICVYSNHPTLEYVRDSFEKTLLSNLEEEDRLPFHGLPIVLLFSADANSSEKDIVFLREEGENHAKILQCPFIDVTSTDCQDRNGDNGCLSTDSQSLNSGLSNEDPNHERWFSEEYLRSSLRALIESVQRKTGIYGQISNQLQPNVDELPEKALHPDMRLLMCFLCGDPYSVDQVISLFICDQNYYVTSANSIVVESVIGSSGGCGTKATGGASSDSATGNSYKKTVELIFSSFHGAQAYRDELLHGFVLVYSATRKASLSTLVAFTHNIPNTPTQILAVTDAPSSTGSVFYSNDLSHRLVAEGSAAADKLQAHFMTTTCSPAKSSFFVPFYKDVWERKPQIEKAFDMEGSEYSLERHTPLPGNMLSGSTRVGSYHGGDESEGIYEQLATSGCENPSSPSFLEQRQTPISPSDDSEMYASVMAGAHHSENGEQLVKPSQLRNRRSLQADLYRQSFKSPDITGPQPVPRDMPYVVASVPPLPPMAAQRGPQVFPPPAYSMNSASPPPYLHQAQVSPKFSGTPRQPLGTQEQMQQQLLVMRQDVLALQSAGQRRFSNRSAAASAAHSSSSGRRRSAAEDNSVIASAPHYALQMRKSNSLKSGPTVSLVGPNVALPPSLRDSHLPDELLSEEEEVSDEEDTVSSGNLSGYGYPPPEPAPPDYPPNLLAAAFLPARRSFEEGWADNQLFDKNIRLGGEEWLENDVYQAYQSEQQKQQLQMLQQQQQQLGPSDRTKPKPGKLNLKQFDNITDAVGRLNITHRQGSTKSHAPLAASESLDYSPDYGNPSKDGTAFAEKNSFGYKMAQNSLDGKAHRVRSLSRRKDNSLEKGSDSESDWSSPERQRQAGQLGGRPERNRAGQPKKLRKKRGIPVAPPRLPFLEGGPSASASSLGAHRAYNPSSQFSEGGASGPSFQQKVLNAAPDYGGSLSPSDLSNGDGAADNEEGRLGFLRKRNKPLHSLSAVEATNSPHSPTTSSPFLESAERSYSVESSHLSYSSSSSKLKIDNSFSCIQPSIEDEFDVLPKEAVSRQLGMLLKSKSANVVAGSDSADKAKERKDKKKLREDEKLEKRRLKEEERQKRLVEKQKKKKQSKNSGHSGPTLEDFVQSEHNLVPLFVEKCIRFIEEEGLDSEGIYRVPGNRAHVDLLFQKFDEEASVSIRELDIPVNAVATALKDFFSKRLPALIPPATMDELTDIANIPEKRNRLIALRELLQKLSSVNFCILKFVFQHFVRISENSRLNSMDSKNLAICWWPTLLPFEFNDMMMFERMRPHLEESVQMMIDQFKLLYCDESEDIIV